MYKSAPFWTEYSNPNIYKNQNSARDSVLELGRQLSIFLNSVFFVLGFGIIFSLLGVLLQTVLLNVSFEVQTWLGRVGGVVIIAFGLYLLFFWLIKIPFLEKEHRLKIRFFRFSYVTSFLFGASFAVGWTPCIGAVLGAILGLAVVNPAGSFGLLFSYSLGLGIPFLLVGLFTQQASALIKKASPWLKYFNFVFGPLLILLGGLVFLNNLALVANFELLTTFLQWIGFSPSLGSGSADYGVAFIGIAFVAGLGSFLSPCVMPLIPGFLTYLASITVKENE